MHTSDRSDRSSVHYPVISSTAVVALLGWLLIISGVLQGLSLIGARRVPHFWLQLISVILAVLIGLLFLRDPAQGILTIGVEGCRAGYVSPRAEVARQQGAVIIADEATSVRVTADGVEVDTAHGGTCL